MAGTCDQLKYVVVIADGAADHRLAQLGDKTPFEAAKKPFTDQISLLGRQGTVATTPRGMACGSDVCSMSLLGYDPRQYHTGRAPLEAAALGIDVGQRDWIFRINWVTVIDGKMLDHSAGQITDRESHQLLEDLTAHLDMPGMAMHKGVSYRNIMVDESAEHDWSKLRTAAPHDIPGQPIEKYLPAGCKEASLLVQMVLQSQAFLAHHPINQVRQDLEQLPATHLWPWGQGTRPMIPSFMKRFGLRGGMITAVDLLAGIASFIGWDRLKVDGQTSYHASHDYVETGKQAVKAIDEYDILCVHVEAPDEASHGGDATTKVQAIEAIDKHVVGPIHQKLQALASRGQGYRLLYLPDHYTAVDSRKHDPTPVPFAMCGKLVKGLRPQPLSEDNAQHSDLHIQFGHELMEYFLLGGLPAKKK